MKTSDIIIILLLLFIITNKNTTNEISSFTRPVLAYEAEVAYRVIDSDFTEEQQAKTSCKCNGTKKVKTGDGLLEIECQCGKNCVCKPSGSVFTETVLDKSEETNLSSYSYMFTTDNCSYCEVFKRDDVPIIKNAGFKVCYDKVPKTEHISIVDINKNPEIYNKYKDDETQAFPMFIVIKNGKVVDKRKSYMNAATFSMWYNNAILNK